MVEHIRPMRKLKENNMKIIKQEQINAILNLLTSYNVGVKDYSAVVKLFNELPNEKKEDKADESSGQGVAS